MIEVSAQTTMRQVPDTRQQAWKLVTASANLVRTRAIELVSKPAKRYRKRRTRNTSKGKKGSQYTIFVGSKPGQPPQVRRGFGRKNVAMLPMREHLTIRLGIRKNADYMVYLEVGTEHIAPRPWLRRALEEMEPVLRSLRLP